MLKAIFGSKTRINILKLFVFNPKKEYYVREIERLIKTSFDLVRRELIHLETIGFWKAAFPGSKNIILLIRSTCYFRNSSQ